VHKTGKSTLTQGAMTLWNECNSYTSSGKETSWANTTQVKALEIHTVKHFYEKGKRFNMKSHQLIAQN